MLWSHTVFYFPSGFQSRLENKKKYSRFKSAWQNAYGQEKKKSWKCLLRNEMQGKIRLATYTFSSYTAKRILPSAAKKWPNSSSSPSS
jgi:hypothetical protein